MNITQIMIVLLCLQLLPTYTWAWGADGHRIVGAIADANLSNQARASVLLLLSDDRLSNGELSQRQTLASIANWADEIRQTPAGQQKSAWHYRNNPVCKTSLGPCKNGVCIDLKIEEMIAILKSPASTHEARNEALKWLVHLVGDIHQPLHAGDNGDKGGNLVPVKLTEEEHDRLELHSVWDTQFVLRALQGNAITAALTSNYSARQPADWMEESRMLAKNVVYKELPLFACNRHETQPILLSKQYQDTAVALVRQQLQTAGLRLAQVLNEIFS